MKKTLLAIAIILGFTAGAMAQSDGFFNNWNDLDNREDCLELPALPNHALSGDQPAAPLGSGLLILTALGAGYALSKRRD